MAQPICDLERQIAQREHALGLLLGQAPGPIDYASGLVDLRIPPDLPAGIPAELLEGRPDIRQAEQQLVAANANVGAAKARFFPTISLTGAFGRLSTALGSLLDAGAAPVRSPGLDVLQTLFAGGAIQANYDTELARLDQAVLACRKSILTALQEVSDQIVAYDRYGQEIEANDKRVAAARESLRLADMRYRAGVASFLDVLDAQRQLLSAETDALTSRGNRRAAAIQLYRALGGGWQTQRTPAPQAGASGRVPDPTSSLRASTAALIRASSSSSGTSA